MADPAAEEERLRLAAVVAAKLKQHSYDWFMYDCPAELLAGRLGRGCRELQEGAISKSATFFANENTLPMEHGSPQVCWGGRQGFAKGGKGAVMDRGGGRDVELLKVASSMSPILVQRPGIVFVVGVAAESISA